MIQEFKQEEAVATIPALDSNEAVFKQRAELKAQKQFIEATLKAIDEDIKPAMLEGERFTDGATELHIVSVETTTCDWKLLVAAKLITQEQIAPFLKRTMSTQIRSRKCEGSSVAPAEGTVEAEAMRERIAKASAGLII